jgi:4-nitrophenyl phosphatase
MKSNQAYIIDMDGTLYRGNSVVPHAVEFIDKLKTNKCKFLLLTNCPRLSTVSLSKKLKGMGIDIHSKNILTSGQAAVFYMKENGMKSAYTVGSTALKKLVTASGIKITEDNPDCVLVGYDNKINYNHISKASRLILSGSRFISTNSDNNIPYSDTFIPHTGAICAAIETATGIKAQYVGKPEKYMLEIAMTLMDCKNEDVCIIGDRLDTDILFGRNHGISTYLVMTGFTNESILKNSDIQPTAVFSNLQELMNCNKAFA